MEPGFWQARWENNLIGFHEGKPNAFLEQHFASLGLAPGARVFVPLCGKTRDIAWLLGHGFKVAGAELSPIAVEQLFAELGVAPAKTPTGALTHYGAEGIDIFQGDIFELTAEILGPVDAIYDRAALVALPPAMRERYARHLMGMTGRSPQLLVAFAYDQSALDGPPFSVPPAEVRAHYEGAYTITELASEPVPGGLKGQCEATEHAWRLSRP